MPTWNTSKPATANSVAADVADIEENFDYLEDLLTYFFKTWSTSSAAIGKNAIYYVNPAAADQGADDNARSAKDLIDAIGADKFAIIYFPHLAVDADTTTFTFGTAETALDNHTLIFENGSIIAGAGAFTIQGTAIALGDLTITGTLVIADGGRLISYGNLTGAGTLTVEAGGALHQFGTNTVTTCTLTGHCAANKVLYRNTTETNTSGTGEDDLMTYTIPANALRVGQALRVTAGGERDPDAADNTATIKFYFGGQSVALGTSISASSTDTEWGTIVMVVPIGTTSARVYATNTLTGYQICTTITSIDTTATQIVKFTGENSRSGSVLRQWIMVVERI